MTDHEMCLLAAKAAGYTVEDRGTWIIRTYEGGISARWFPLEYSGHAFELMVGCSLVVDVCDECRDVTVRNNHHAVLAEVTYEDHNGDKHAATRRAITRAAAAMGEAKCG